MAPQELPRAFNRQSVWRRFAIVARRTGRQFPVRDPAVLGAVHARRAGGAADRRGTRRRDRAAQRGLARGDTIRAIDGEPVTTWQDVRWRAAAARARAQAGAAGGAETRRGASTGARSICRARDGRRGRGRPAGAARPAALPAGRAPGDRPGACRQRGGARRPARAATGSRSRRQAHRELGRAGAKVARAVPARALRSKSSARARSGRASNVTPEAGAAGQQKRSAASAPRPTSTPAL